MKAVWENASIGFAVLPGYPGLFTSHDEVLVRFMRELLSEDAGPGKVSFGTEGGLFSERLAIPALVCGPGGIGQAHKADEYVSIEQLAVCDTMMQNLVKRQVDQ